MKITNAFVLPVVCLSLAVYPTLAAADEKESGVTESAADAVTEVRDAAPDVLEEFRDGIRSNWRKLSERCSELIELQDEMPRLPEKAWFKRDRRDQNDRIREQLQRIRALLLSTDSGKILADIETIDAKIADVDDDIRDAKEKKFINPGNDEKYDAKIAKCEAKRRALEERRAEAAGIVLAELDEIGLRMSGDAAEKCIFTVNVEDLIDAAVVAKHVGLVVEALGEQMKSQSGDVVAAKRYYGVYVAMLEVQKSCFDDYLGKSREGPWRRRLAEIRNEAAEQRAAALRGAGDASFDDSQRAVFRKNAEVKSEAKRS